MHFRLLTRCEDLQSVGYEGGRALKGGIFSLKYSRPDFQQRTRIRGGTLKKPTCPIHSHLLPRADRALFPSRYDYMVVAPGLKTNWDAIPGLIEGLADTNGPVASTYGPESATKMSRNVKAFTKGTAVSLRSMFRFLLGGLRASPPAL